MTAHDDEHVVDGVGLFELTRYFSYTQRGSDRKKRGLREVKIVRVLARGADVGDGHSDSLAVVSVREPDLPAAVGRNGVEAAVERGLYQMVSISATSSLRQGLQLTEGRDEVAVLVNYSACANQAALEEEGSAADRMSDKVTEIRPIIRTFQRSHRHRQ